MFEVLIFEGMFILEKYDWFLPVGNNACGVGIDAGNMEDSTRDRLLTGPA